MHGWGLLLRQQVVCRISSDNLITQFYKGSSLSFIPHPKPHYYLTAGILAPLSENILLKPSFLIKDDRAGPTSLDLTMFVILQEKLSIGCSYRTAIKLYNKSYLQPDLEQAIHWYLLSRFCKSKNFSIGYGYDLSVGPLQGYSGGTHEITIGYFFGTKNLEC